MGSRLVSPYDQWAAYGPLRGARGVERASQMYLNLTSVPNPGGALLKNLMKHHGRRCIVYPARRRYERLARATPDLQVQDVDAKRTRALVDRTAPGFRDLHTLVRSAGVLQIDTVPE